MVNRFWDMVEKARQEGEDNLDRIYEILYNDLMKLDIPELFFWGKILEEYYRIADTTSLHEVASELGDTEYHEYRDFCSWLLSKGRKVFFAVLKNPRLLLEKNLLDESQDDLSFQELPSLPVNVYLKKRNMKYWDPTVYQSEASRYTLPEGMYIQMRQMYVNVG